VLLAKTSLRLYCAPVLCLVLRRPYGAMLSISFLIDYIELLRRGRERRAGSRWGFLLEMAALKLPHNRAGR